MREIMILAHNSGVKRILMADCGYIALQATQPLRIRYRLFGLARIVLHFAPPPSHSPPSLARMEQRPIFRIFRLYRITMHFDIFPA